MPRQNRVDPFGNLIATPARGDFFGNRGALHNDQGQIRRPWQLKRWITCVLEFKGRHRQIMTPGYYTELFFLDEATAFAAGHRPCAECRRADYNRFRELWAQANPDFGFSRRPLATEIDEVLHRERLTAQGQQRRYQAPLSALPEGTFILLESPASIPYLVTAQHLWPWTPGGYGPKLPRPAEATVQVLTPPSVGRTLAAGYKVRLHASAHA